MEGIQKDYALQQSVLVSCGLKYSVYAKNTVKVLN